MAISSYLEQKLMANTYSGVAYTPPTNWYVALYTSTGPIPTDASVNELSTGGYSRMEFFPDTIVGPDYIMSNDADIQFPTAEADWPIINHIGIIDNLGNLLDYGPITTPRTVLLDGIFKILLGELDVQFQSCL